MSVPKPPQPLQGNCAAIDGNTLFVYDADSFQSLPLEKNATWTKGDVGQSVASPACVNAAASGDGSENALYVVGGETNDNDYMGVQRYFFGNQSWETLSPPASVLRTRTNHSAAYLEDSRSILVYGGSQPDAPSELSSQTFLLSTQPPYNIRSFVSHSAPPTNNAILQPWNSSHAVMVGGQSTNTEVWLFGPDQGWSQLGTNLPAPLDPSSRAVLVDGDDGSKVLQVYNVNTSPNTAEGIVLLDAGGRTAKTGQTVGGDSTSRKRKRDLTINNWPSYNNTNAPTSTRGDCSIAQNPRGLVVMAGGNTDDPVIMFNQRENSWIDADRFFDSKQQQQQPLQPSSTSSTTDTRPSETTSSTPTPASSGGLSAHDKMLRILGITLGALCGVAVLFILVLLYLRWRRNKRNSMHGIAREKGGAKDSDRMSFTDRGASFMKEAGMSTHELVLPSQDRYNPNKHNSQSSLAIIAGRIGNRRSAGAQQAPRGSFESTTRLVRDKDGKLVPLENHEMGELGVEKEKAPPKDSSLTVPGAVRPGAISPGTFLDQHTRAERKRSSGWSKYFATSQPTGPNGLSHLPSAYIKPNTLSVDSVYSQDRVPSQESRIPSSALVAPLDVGFEKTIDGQRLSHVAQFSPAVSDSRDDLAARGGSLDIISDGQKGVIVDSADPRKSQPNSISSFGNRSTLSSNITGEFYNESGQTPWTPMSGADSPVLRNFPHERETSSVYTNSVYETENRRPSRGKGPGFFPGTGVSYRPSKVKLSHNASPTADWASPRMPAAQPATERDSTVTVFPSAASFQPEGKKDTVPPMQQTTKIPTAVKKRTSQRISSTPITNTDMSWLKLDMQNQS